MQTYLFESRQEVPQFDAGEDLSKQTSTRKMLANIMVTQIRDYTSLTAVTFSQKLLIISRLPSSKLGYVIHVVTLIDVKMTLGPHLAIIA
jgi:hypothetical protein